MSAPLIIELIAHGLSAFAIITFISWIGVSAGILNKTLFRVIPILALLFIVFSLTLKLVPVLAPYLTA